MNYDPRFIRDEVHSFFKEVGLDPTEKNMNATLELLQTFSIVQAKIMVKDIGDKWIKVISEPPKDKF